MPKLVDNNYTPPSSSPLHEFVEQPKVAPVEYQSAIVDNRKDRLDTLLQYAEGSYAKVVYFRQRLGKSESVTDFSLDVSAPHQQYERIDGFEIIMQGSISTSNSGSDQRITEITGEALVRQPLIPNVSDIFLMDFGRGNLGWFKVTSSRRMSHRKNTLYEIQFSLVYEINDEKNDKRLLNLNSKVVEVFAYSSDYLKSGQNPLITPKQADQYEFLLKEYRRLRSFWFRKFYSRFEETCLLPNQTKRTYDGFFMKAIRQWFSSKDVPEMIYFRILDDSEHSIMKTPTVWDAIVQQDIHLLRQSFSEAVSVSVSAFSITPQFASIRFSGFDCVMMPAKYDYNNDVYLHSKDIIGATQPLNTSVNPKESFTYQDIPLINDVNLMKSYVFSKAFYLDDHEGQSHLEIQLRKYLNDDTLQIDVIEKLIEDIYHWGELEQYYFTPVLLVLINYASRRMNG